MQDLLGQPVDFDSFPPQRAAELIYDLADLEPRGSAERTRLYALASRYALAARTAAAKAAAAEERRQARAAEDIARIKRASHAVPA
jgi:hypothetical protein